MKKNLLQVIVNTQGLARAVAQERDALGRFTGKARVGTLLSPGHVLHLAAQSERTVVVVQHSFFLNQQTVSSVNRDTKKGNAVTFINDGKGTQQHDSLYTK
jgi:hypothetical protein